MAGLIPHVDKPGKSLTNGEPHPGIEETNPQEEMEEKALKKGKRALLAVLIGIMVAMSGCFGGDMPQGV